MAASLGTSFVWVWRPGATEPVPAGRVDSDGRRLRFTYGASYRARPDAVALYEPELPLRAGTIAPSTELDVASCLRDAAPDSWGQRVILDRVTGRHGRTADVTELPVLTYLRQAGSDRIGALDFQDSPVQYVPRSEPAPLEELLDSASRFAEGKDVSAALAEALVRGTSIGGAQPKVLVNSDSAGSARRMIAKFSVADVSYPVVKAEAAAMSLARRVGLDVATTSSVSVMGRDVLLVDRFDRPGCVGSAPGVPGQRRMMVSALTVLGGDERGAHYLRYTDLADAIRARFTQPRATLRELFSRIVFNILVSNTDDHARNHSAFWDGERLTLTPAYDICPSLRRGDTAAQAMGIDRAGNRAARLGVCLAAAADYLLDRDEAQQIIDAQKALLADEWAEAADEARLTHEERRRLWGLQFLNPAVDYGDWR